MEKEKIAGSALKKTGGFFAEFKKFIAKGNVMDLAVGVIIGAAFQNIVAALTGSFINPLIALLTGGCKKNPETGALELVGGQFTVKGVTFDYGAFISAVINFLIMALILFILIRSVNKLMALGKKKEAAAPAGPTKDQELLMEIRDLLKAQAATTAAAAAEADAKADTE